tara:strand:+ start:1726 stop:2001 length:276 start_codon:yes stop_codon:yes gene_type:complete
MLVTLKKSQSLKTAADEVQHVELIAHGDPSETTHYTVNWIVNGNRRGFATLKKSQYETADIIYDNFFTSIIEQRTTYMEELTKALSAKLLG